MGYKKRSNPQYGRRTITVRVPRTTFKRGSKIVERKAYTYEKEDVGLPGKGPKLILVEKGKLSKYGYSTALPAEKRREALKKAVKAYGALSVFRKLQAMVIVRKRTQLKARKVFESDRDWVRENYKVDGFAS